MAKYQPRDRFFRKAKAQGLPSRAAFKLEELLGRYKLVVPGARVLDLGCAPGGWLAILSRAVGERGRVVGVDLVATKAPDANLTTIAGDLRALDIRAAARERLGGSADLITSDMAPKLSGIRDRDQARMRELIELAIEVAHDALSPGGAMIVKAFMSADFEDELALFKREFSRVDVTHPAASRPGSAELYIIARNFKPAS